MQRKVKTLLVIGGSGFIGSHVVKQLLKKGESVRVLDIKPCGRDVEFIEGSILDQDILQKAFEGVSRVYHLAANANLWAKDKDIFERVNHQGTRNVLNAAKKAGVERLVYTSTEAVLLGGGRRDIDESISPSEKHMLGAYPLSKLRAEKAALATEGLEVVVVNPTIPIGAGDFSLTPPTRMLIDFLNGKTPLYLDSVLNLVDVGDVAKGHILAMEKGKSGKRYILGGENVDMRRMLEILEEVSSVKMPTRKIPYFAAYGFAVFSQFVSDYITHKPPIAPISGVRIAGCKARFNNSLAKKELGFKHKDIKTSLTQAVLWLREEGYIA